MKRWPRDYEITKDNEGWWVTYPPRSRATSMGPYEKKQAAVDDAELEIVQFCYDAPYDDDDYDYN